MMILILIDSPGGKRWGVEDCVTPDSFPNIKRKNRRIRLNPMEDIGNSHTCTSKIHLKICFEITC